MREIKCAVCGKVFESKQYNAKYCSEKCYKIASRPSQKKSYKKYIEKKAEQRRKERETIVGTCKICGSPIKRETGRLKYCSDECATIGKNMSVKKYWKKRHTLDKEHRDRLNLELKEIRKKSQLNKNIKDLQKNGESLGLKDYDYGKYARLKGL